MKRILIPIPNQDFDLTEVAVPWKLFKNKGYDVIFATENGQRGYCDPKLITGVIFGQLGATAEAIGYYRELEKDEHFVHPVPFAMIEPSAFDLLMLPGGHAQGMRPYLENKSLQQKVLIFFQQDKLIGAICHGCIVLARTVDPSTGQAVIRNKKMTALTKFLERTGYWLTAWKLGGYYRTYPAYVQDEVKAALDRPDNFTTGTSPFKPFVCVDEKLVTARWPKDAFLFANTLIQKLEHN